MIDHRYGCYWKAVARQLGIPEECYGEDWPSLLVSSVAAAASPPKAPTGLTRWTHDLMDGLLSMCGGTEAETGVVPSPPTIDGLDLTNVQNTPIIVFDDFSNVKDDDILFMRELFPIVFAHKVLMFVMVHDEATANKLSGLNGWRRIAPLMDICRPIPSQDGKTIQPEWMPIRWTRSQLEEIVLSRYGNIDMQSLSEVLSRDGANPLDVLRYAETKSWS
jgi:hypothetical protein